MPMGGKKFSKLRQSKFNYGLSNRILKFLKKRKDKAFSYDELAKHTNAKKRSIYNSVTFLKEKNLVTVKRIYKPKRAAYVKVN